MKGYYYIYLHGFASSPRSSKAQYFRSRFAHLGISLNIPDLNQGDFYNLTLTRQLNQVKEILTEINNSVIIIGSSFGGLTATWLGQNYEQVKGLILLSPAFDFLIHLESLLGEDAMQQWQKQGEYQFYHYEEERSLSLSYQFREDLAQYQENNLKRVIPTLIFHGIKDTVIPIESSRIYRDTHQEVKLIELDSDHSLNDVLPQIWLTVRDEFFYYSKLNVIEG